MPDAKNAVRFHFHMTVIALIFVSLPSLLNIIATKAKIESLTLNQESILEFWQRIVNLNTDLRKIISSLEKKKVFMVRDFFKSVLLLCAFSFLRTRKIFKKMGCKLFIEAVFLIFILYTRSKICANFILGASITFKNSALMLWLSTFLFVLAVYCILRNFFDLCCILSMVSYSVHSFFKILHSFYTDNLNAQIVSIANGFTVSFTEKLEELCKANAILSNQVVCSVDANAKTAITVGVLNTCKVIFSKNLIKTHGEEVALAAILHEIGHIKNNDLFLSMLYELTQDLLILIFSVWFYKSRKAEYGKITTMIYLRCFIFGTHYVSNLLALYISRLQELNADLNAVKYGYGLKLAAFFLISCPYSTNHDKCTLYDLTMTHPSVYSRIEELTKAIF